MNLVDTYLKWLKDNTTLKKIGGLTEITTPFTNCFNDYIQFYVEKKDNSFILTDEGETISNLKFSGVEINTPHRKKELQRILNTFGVRLEKDTLKAISTIENFAQTKHLFIQALMNIDDMYLLSTGKTESFFLDDVKDLFDNNQIDYLDNFMITGKSGLPRQIDFFVTDRNKRKNYIKLINRISKQKIELTIFTFDDIKRAREEEFNSVLLINDREESLDEKYENEITAYGCMPVYWSEREDFVHRLTA